MRQFAFISIHPSFIDSYLGFGVMAAATRRDLINIQNVSLRQFAVDRHGSVDAPPYGGGDGMVLRPEPLAAAVQDLKKQMPQALVACPSPQGKIWQHSEAIDWAKSERDMIFICGRFAGIDQRFLDTYVDFEYSLGDFVISGGELAALAMADSILRLIPGVLGHPSSGVEDSFAEGMAGQLEYPLYTKPVEFEGQKVPEVLLSGHHDQIWSWRKQQALEVTKKKRPDLLKS